MLPACDNIVKQGIAEGCQHGIKVTKVILMPHM